MSANLEPLLNRLTILNKKKEKQPLLLNPAQKYFLNAVHQDLDNGKPLRYIVLKARQMGLSTLIEGMIFTLAFGWYNSSGVVLSHDKTSARKLLAMTQLYWNTYPFKSLYNTVYHSRNELSWKETESSIEVVTAKSANATRGATFNLIHASEIAFWLNAEELMLGMVQTLPETARSFLALESTANGIGNYFYNQWKAAEAGDIDMTPIFFPWYMDPTYRASYINLPIRRMRLDSEERILRKVANVDDDQLMWRRWAIKNRANNDIIKFHQEYPATPEEAFISTGMNVFPVKKLAACYQPEQGATGILRREGRRVMFVTDPEGELTIYRMPADSRDYGVYFIAGDPTHTTRGDYAAIQVINRRTYEQVAVWRGKIDPVSFATPIANLGRFYNDAMVTSEVEGPGYATIGGLMESGYPYVWRKRGADRLPGKVNDNYGWSTTHKTKEWAINLLLKLIMDGDITIHDKRTFYELRDYVTLSSGGYGPADPNGFDDLVMSLAIACICSTTEGGLAPYMGESGYIEELEHQQANPVSAPWEEWGSEVG